MCSNKLMNFLKILLKIFIIIIVALLIVYIFYIITTSCRSRASTRTIVSYASEVSSKQPANVVLHWILPSDKEKVAVLDGNVLIPGKTIQMEETFDDKNGPQFFNIYEYYDSFFDWLCRKYGKTSEPITSPFSAQKVKSGLARSDRYWLLPTPSNFRGQSTFIFKDDRDNSSGKISSSSLALIEWKLGVRASSNQGKLGTVSVSGGAEIGGGIKLANDPEIYLLILAPWEKGEANLNNYLIEYLKYLRGFYPWIEIDDSLRLLAEYLPKNRPEGWRLNIEPATIKSSPSIPGNFRLILKTDLPGKTFLAIKATEKENPRNFSISEIIGVEATGLKR
jgi:hypothetical protein